MLISPKTAIEKGWVKFPEWMDDEFRAKCIQPNALDITVDKLFSLNDHTSFVISETEKKMRGVTEVATDDGHWALMPKASYDFASDFYVDVPAGVAVMFIIRSTFNRNGLFITTGLYDSGFQGAAAGVLHNRSGAAFIAPHTRIAQMMLVTSDSVGMYAGGYNHAQGTHWYDDVLQQEYNPK